MATIKHWIKVLMRILRLDAELEDHAIVQEAITKGIIFKGTNLWILIFAIVVASVGLNMNSTAVIIGAMLISPLMGPINGIGFSIATYNVDLFKRSIKNFAFAVVASISASTIYFLLSPVSNAQSELLARTSPTIFDVIIALFGGFAGIVAMSSKNKGNVIPGVAIATALMPPLCTVGYGIASGNPSYFLGALYLFTINTVFIALSSMIVTQVLKFPKHSFIPSKYKQVTKMTLWIVISITVLPSFYLGYTLVKKERFQNSADLYTTFVANYNENFLLRHSVDADNRKIQLIYGGNNLSTDEKRSIKNEAKQFGLDPKSVQIIQGLKMNDFKNEFSEIDKLKTEFSSFSQLIQQKDATIDSLKSESLFGEQLLKEMKVLDSDIKSVIYTKTNVFENGKRSAVTLIRIESEKNVNNRSEDMLKNWLKERVNADSLLVVIEE